MPITLDQREALNVIRLLGEVDIISAAELKKILLQALTSGKPLQLELEAATDVDIATLQLLWAAERDVRRAGLRFTRTGQLPETIAQVATDAGFEQFPVSGEAQSRSSGKLREATQVRANRTGETATDK
jgi:anti-anti-sigma regulatory factor